MKTRTMAILTSMMIILAGLFVASPANASEISPNVANPSSSSVVTSRPAHFKMGVAVPLSVLAAESATNSGSNIVSPREPAGQYYYNCVNTDGSSYFLSQGEPLSNCHGSYLQTYINGVQVRVVSLTTSGAISNPNAITVDCAIAIVGATIVVLTPEGTIAWVLSAAVGGISFARACTA
ncbi:hypothetical protein [Arthrobacter alpinus]|uniref:hypothetical protein n=1 Tax=Arthrobacter alpinus TaxID=656366 RepID=UPI00164595C5|nr:hypothetical protein [Arthrobacter alpinus]